MQSFFIFCKVFLVYRVDTSAETDTWQKPLITLDFGFDFINAFLNWFNPAQTY